MKTKKKPAEVQIAQRIPSAMAKRLDALIAKRTADRPHLPATRSELVREAIQKLLDAEGV